MKNSLVLAIVTMCVFTACNKKADESTPEITTENATEVVSNAEAPVEDVSIEAKAE